MATLSLRISLEGRRVTKTMQFDPSTTIFDCCRIIREKITEANAAGQMQDFGLFLSDDDSRQGVWLEPARKLDYYLLRNGDLLEYRRKLRHLRVRMLDGSVKTLLVDDSQPVACLMVVICTKIGITNHDEYSLVRDEPENPVEPLQENRYGTLTLRRKNLEKERDTKMENLRKKLKTDDEVNWVDPGKTLRQQGIDESETVLLRRKYFFSDQNIDSRDPVQLNLLYVQARDAILDGKHPVTQDKACEFAGIQCHIQFGNYNEQKHKPGFLDLKEFLPQSYARVKGIEKKVFSEHKKHYDTSEVDAKVLYTRTARALKTYGVTFFLVKEKMKGKNKLVPRLLGVTKDSVLRLDEKTKEILKTWPLTTVRRWCASPNTFTLDFGDYSDQYYSVQTTEAEQIQQLIAGYIDIILKKKQTKDHFGIEGDEGSTMVEDSVSPFRATIIQHELSKTGKVNTESLAKPAVMRAGGDGSRPYAHGHVGASQLATVSGQINIGHTPPLVKQSKVTSVLTEPQQALLSDIYAGQEVISNAKRDLETKAEIPELGSDPASVRWRESSIESSKQSVTSHIAAMSAATAQVVTLTSGGDKVDHNAVGAAVSTIAMNLPEMTKGVRLIAALIDDNTSGEKLLEAARSLCSAFSDLLKAAEPENKEPTQLISAASKVGEASHQVLSSMGEESEESREVQDMLLALAKAVANSTAALVLKAKNIAATCEDPNAQNKVIEAATQCALATSQLVACAKVVAPSLQSPACREQLETAAREVVQAVQTIIQVCSEATSNTNMLNELNDAAAEVSRTLKDLLNNIKNINNDFATTTVEESHIENVYVATDLLIGATDPTEMVKQARVLGQATANLIQSIKVEAEKQPDSELQHKLLAAAKQLADATAKMVEAARLCASSPNEPNHQEALRVAAEELRDITASAPILRKKLINRLEQCAKRAASAATQCISAAQNATMHSSDIQVRETLLEDCKTTSSLIPKLVSSVKSSMSYPDDPNVQIGLINSAQTFLEPAEQTCDSCRSLLPTVTSQSCSTELSRSCQVLSSALNDLSIASTRAREACAGLEMGAALESVGLLRQALHESRIAAERRTLMPLPGETIETTSFQLSSSSKSVSMNMAHLISAVNQNNRYYASNAARDAASSLHDFNNAVRGVAATTNNINVIDCADEVIMNAMRVIEEAYRSLQGESEQQYLMNAASSLNQALSNTIDCLPGQKDVDEAINRITSVTEVLSLNEFPSSNKSYNQLQQELTSAAETLHTASGEIVNSAKSPSRLAQTSHSFSQAYNELLLVSLELAGLNPDEMARGQVVISLQGVSTSSCTLLTSAKKVAADPSQPNAKNQLTAAARAVTESINYLVDVCTSASPAQKECDNAIRKIESLRPLLDRPNEALSDLSYFECLDVVKDKSKSLGEGMSGIANHAKHNNHEEFAHSIREVNDSIYGLIEASAQAAYLVGVSDPTSVVGRPGLVDQTQFARAAQAIRTGCDVLVAPTSTQQQVLGAATIIAKHTSALCNACRIASNNTSNLVAKRQFVQSAKDVANSTAALVKGIKALDADYSPESRESCVQATKPLLDAVSSLCEFSNNPQFVSVPTRISPQGRKAQEPILSSGHSILNAAVNMIIAAKSLSLSPRDPPAWQQLASNSKDVSDSIKSLITSIREKAPGQTQCDTVIQQLKECVRHLDQTSINVVSTVTPSQENSLQGFLSQMGSTANELSDRLPPLQTAAKSEAENLGHTVLQMSRYVEALVKYAMGAATHFVHSAQRLHLLEYTKSVTENALQVANLAKLTGGNPRAKQYHGELDEAIDSMRESITELISSLEELSTQNGYVNGLLESINRAMSRVSDRRSSLLVTSTSDSFVDYQTRMVHEAKEIARISNEMSSKAVAEPAALSTLAANLTHHYTQLADDSHGAVLNTNLSDVAMKIKSTVQELGRSCSQLVEASGPCQMQQVDYASSNISMHSRSVNDKVAKVLAALQSCSRGTQACINAASTVSGIIGDIDTTIMFATAGTLHSERDNASFAEHREHILKTAKALVEDTKTLVAGAAGSQDQLAAAAQNAVSTIVQLAGVVKLGAESLGSNNPDSQVMLMNAVKDVASALGELIQATKAASGKPIDDPSMGQLKGSARVMVTNVTSLLKTVKAVEDKHTRGTRALESTIEAISQEINSLSIDGARGKGSPEELVRASKLVTQATSKAIAAGNSGSQEDIIIAANQGRRAISELLVICKNTAYSCTETIELRQQTLEAGNKVALHYKKLLEAVLAGSEGKENLPYLSRQVAQSVSELVSLAETLKGRDWVDPEDPTVIAENELLTAASSIEAAARKLASLRPRRSVKETDENLNFDEMILEAAKSITAATSALVKAASDSQRELIDQGKVARRLHKTSDDGQWSEGLVSAARLVVAATQKLVDSAQALVQGLGSEEILISSAKQVASSTAQLLVASQVKADPDSPSFTRLQAAGNAVIKSTDNLVKSAQQAISGEDEHSLVLNTRMVGGITQEINARSEVFRIEKQLEEARSRLAAIHQAKYKLRKTDEGDQEYYSDQNESFNQSTNTTQMNNNNQSNKASSQSFLDKSQTQSRTFNAYNNVSPVSFINKNLSASESTYDGVKNGSTFNTGSNGQNYKGFTSSYETHRYNTNASPVILHSTNMDSQNLVQTQMNSLTRQITEKKTIMSSSESRTHSHSYKLE